MRKLSGKSPVTAGREGGIHRRREYSALLLRPGQWVCRVVLSTKTTSVSRLGSALMEHMVQTLAWPWLWHMQGHRHSMTPGTDKATATLQAQTRTWAWYRQSYGHSHYHSIVMAASWLWTRTLVMAVVMPTATA